jgi:hypothetical protein
LSHLADFALNDLPLKLGAVLLQSTSSHPSKPPKRPPNPAQTAFISESDVLGPRKKAEADYEERVASILAWGREGREEVRLPERQMENRNTEQLDEPQQAIMMIMGSKGVRGKRKQSLQEKQKRLRQGGNHEWPTVTAHTHERTSMIDPLLPVTGSSNSVSMRALWLLIWQRKAKSVEYGQLRKLLFRK